MKKRDERTTAERWAHLRFAIIGALLAAPPRRGELRAALEKLSEKTWEHPTSGEPVQFAASTIERWLYKARNEARDPVGALRRKTRKDAGTRPGMSDGMRRALEKQYRENDDWNAKLHRDNLLERARLDPSLGQVPSYATVVRYMRSVGMKRRKRRKSARTEGAREAAARLEQREVCGYEHEYVGGLWHWDFHECSRKVVTANGLWVTPVLFGMLDDCSRVCCHLQWYLSEEDTESLIHGLCQGLMKFGLPRSGMSDRGSAMRAAETAAGFSKLGISHEFTLPYSAYQNGKQEAFWTRIEDRLMPMLRGVRRLDLKLLNEATQAWVTGEYNKSRHSELGESPLSRFLRGPSVLRESPDAETLRLAFRRRERRRVRRSDGTISLRGRRFEAPPHLRHVGTLHVRFAEWDLTRVDVEDPNTGALAARLYPQDKARNADGRRRRLARGPHNPTLTPLERPDQVGPLLARYMHEARSSGLPPAYIPVPENRTEEDDETDFEP